MNGNTIGIPMAALETYRDLATHGKKCAVG